MLLNLVKHPLPDFDKIYLYVKYPFKSKYQLIINGREKVGIEILKNPKAFIYYTQTIDHIYENLEQYNPRKKGIVIKVCDDMIADVEAHKNLSPIFTEFFQREIKVNILLLYVSQSFSKVPKTIRLNVTH